MLHLKIAKYISCMQTSSVPEKWFVGPLEIFEGGAAMRGTLATSEKHPIVPST